MDRRDFLKQTVEASIGTALLGSALVGCSQSIQSNAKSYLAIKHPPKDLIKIGFVGIGHQGSSHIQNLLRIDGAEITAVCDIRPESTDWAIKAITATGFNKPAVYGRDNIDYVRMCENEDLDLIYNATPWRYHTPISVAAMKNSKHAASEVNIAITIDDCWELVETAEKTKQYCIMMENCCYDRTEMMVMNMINQGLLGEIMHGECGYLHDLRELKLSPDFYQGMWRLQHSIKRNGNLYPTHGLGPMAWCMDINRGDAFDTLVSLSGKAIGLHEYAQKHYPEWAEQSFALGDVNICLIKTKLGKTIICKHDTNLPRPYSRDFLVQGTNGLVRKYPEELIYIEGKSQGDNWEPLRNYIGEFEHRVWRDLRERSRGAGHGGMDYIEDYRLIQALRKGIVPDIDVYDSVSWCSVTPLSEKSVAKGGESVSFPDFTRGIWKVPRILGVFENIL